MPTINDLKDEIKHVKDKIEEMDEELDKCRDTDNSGSFYIYGRRRRNEIIHIK